MTVELAISLCMHIQYRYLPYRADRIEPPCMVKIVTIIGEYYTYTGYTWLLDLRVKRGRQTLRLNGFPAEAYRETTVDYINIESENQKSSLLVFFHSACPYKNYCLKYFTKLQTLFINFIYLFKFSILLRV